MGARRFLGYSITFWQRGGHWYSWVESPQGQHIFINEPTFFALETTINHVIKDDLTSHKEGERELIND